MRTGEDVMSDDSVKTLWATFTTREAADRAVEHLVQQAGIARGNVFVQASNADNTAGTELSGGDAGKAENVLRSDAPLNGEIEVSADVAHADVIKAEKAFREAGAGNVMAR
jgi:hypothetical protein